MVARPASPVCSSSSSGRTTGHWKRRAGSLPSPELPPVETTVLVNKVQSPPAREAVAELWRCIRPEARG